MTYRELYEQLIEKYADEKGIIRGKPCSILYRISRAAEVAGFDSVVDEAFKSMIYDISFAGNNS